MPRVVLDSLNAADAERKLVAAALEYSETLVGAAEKLGISYGSLRYKMRKFGLKRDGRPKAGFQ